MESPVAQAAARASGRVPDDEVACKSELPHHPGASGVQQHAQLVVEEVLAATASAG